MIVAILCPGPSLASLDARPPVAWTIAVNRAARRFACDFWAVTDLPLLRSESHAVAGDPLILTTAEVTRRLNGDRRARCIDLGPTLERWRPIRAGLFTACAALAYAANMGPDAIDVYGMDRTDGPDFDGVTPESARRTPDRWSLEREIWDSMVAALVDRGVAVNRVRTAQGRQCEEGAR